MGAEDGKVHDRNAFAFWVLITLLFALTLANLALTLTIISVLPLGRDIELCPEENSIKFPRVDLDRIHKRDGKLEGFSNVPVTIEGGQVHLNIVHRNGHVHNRVMVGQNETHLKNANHFEIRHPSDGHVLFSTVKPTYSFSAGHAKNLRTDSATTASRVSSATDEKLRVQTLRGKLAISGAEGVLLNAKALHWAADQSILLRAINGSIDLAASNYYLDRVATVHQQENGIRMAELQFKLCACLPAGNLFRVLVPRGIHAAKVSCTHFVSDFNPCE